MIYKQSSILICVDTNDYVYIYLDDRVTRQSRNRSLSSAVSNCITVIFILKK